MTERSYILPPRKLLRITGEDKRSFLQGLISNDIEKVTPERAIWAALLTAQGKFLHDFFIAEMDDAFLLAGEAERIDDLKRRLSMYKLRARVALEIAEGWQVALAYGAEALAALDLPAEPGAARRFGGGVAFVDPRLAEAGACLFLPDLAPLAAAGFQPGDQAGHERLRISLGLPDGSRDMQVDKAILLENGFDELHGVDWKKGCYVGQELTARTKYRGLIKKRLMPVAIDGPSPEAGAIILLGDREAGEMRSAEDGQGLALIRLEALQNLQESGESALRVGDTRLTPRKPGWAGF
ncbi:MAG: folate-binding protein [Alphaproteobacteria bacterium]|nr:folate-binding protein [Alphaproteobacteria bacterium]MBU0795713.1 folate-binding protein [Alphaproteobacteria bacterium]MBU0887336.1 folate-binding protein [Alphaproteobacteria bacterium]MBU1811783.1 folate-binding protein [Alphaproteobacteria bacterium]